MGTLRYLFQASVLSARTENLRGTPSSGSAASVVTLMGEAAPPPLRRSGSSRTIKPARAGMTVMTPPMTTVSDFLKKPRRPLSQPRHGCGAPFGLSGVLCFGEFKVISRYESHENGRIFRKKKLKGKLVDEEAKDCQEQFWQNKLWYESRCI